jgi:anthranilate synthase component 1
MDDRTPPQLNVSLDEFAAIAASSETPQIITVSACLPAPGKTPFELYSLLRTETGFLLESIDPDEHAPDCSILGFGEVFSVAIPGNGRIGTDLVQYRNGSPRPGDDPFTLLRDLTGIRHRILPEKRHFLGGFVGYIAYDSVFAAQRGVKATGKIHDPAPLARFLYAPGGIFFDHRSGCATIFYGAHVLPGSDPAAAYRRAEAFIRETTRRIRTEAPPGRAEGGTLPPAAELQDLRSSPTQGEFEDSVRKTLEYIHAGEILQAVISREVSCTFHADPIRIYKKLREQNPGPYMYLLEFGDVTIAGSSPEMLLKVEGRRVTTVPIAGTRPRGATAEEDRFLAEELRTDAKECAEHIMLVDLARNDIGRVAKFGTVTVDRFMEVKKYSHVQHIVSEVAGELREGLDGFDALASCFPAGTVSGAPKIRAIEIIDELEETPRGIYAGAIGFIELDGDMEFAITIRSVIVADRRATIRAGAGIVADSVPEREYTETSHKAAALVRAVSEAEAEE